MSKECLEKEYDVVVIGSGLAGLTGANALAKQGHSVLLLEQHFKLGGLATWFKRKGGFIFDVSLHGFPVGMIKSCKRYWTKEIADSIVQLKGIRFENPQFSFFTSFDREDFTEKLISQFGVEPKVVEAFFQHLKGMNFYDDDQRSTGELFEEFFPGRPDIHRLLMEPITYANGSTLEDPAITYGIVFSNFMSKGVFTFRGGSDLLIQKMREELLRNKVTIATKSEVEQILVEKSDEGYRAAGVVVDGKPIKCKAVLSNANLKTTILDFVGRDYFDEDFVKLTDNVRINSSSCQVYMGIKPGEKLDDIGDLIFTSEAENFSSEELKSLRTKSRTFSIYYPDIRPESKDARYHVVASLNGLWKDWEGLDKDGYEKEKERLCKESVESLKKFVPDIESKIEWIEAATPRTFHRYTKHIDGSSFGTKFEGLEVSMGLPEQIKGLFHAGSVGIIMSGWLGAINYGIITANKIDSHLLKTRSCM